MTPAARLAAAIEVLDQIIGGEPAQKCLTNWARRSRYAGSKDRAAVRDITFECLRRRRSYGHLGGSDSGRGLAIGYQMASGGDLAAVFGAAQYGPAALTSDERDRVDATCDEPPTDIALDVPDGLGQVLRSSLDDSFSATMALLQARAEVFLRVNVAKTTRNEAAALLGSEGIDTAPVELSPTALQVTANPRRVALSKAYEAGVVEIQDAASQAVVDCLPLDGAARILDYCAGGGGKSLAMAARTGSNGQIFAHDISPTRLKSLEPRAIRAGVSILTLGTEIVTSGDPYDLVLVDAPCSGSGAWRRNPDAKWRLTEADLADFQSTQGEILNTCAPLTSPTGTLAYVTCSLFRSENEDRVTEFLATHPDWRLDFQHRFLPHDGGDGFYIANLTRK